MTAVKIREPAFVVGHSFGGLYVLTFAAHRFLSAPVEEGGRGLPVHLTGVDVKEQSREHNSAVAARLGAAAGKGDLAGMALGDAGGMMGGLLGGGGASPTFSGTTTIVLSAASGGPTVPRPAPAVADVSGR